MDISIYGLNYEQWERLIDLWIFDERARKMLKRHLLDNIKFEPLAEEFQLSVVHTKTIVGRYQKILFKHI